MKFLKMFFIITYLVLFLQNVIMYCLLKFDNSLQFPNFLPFFLSPTHFDESSCIFYDFHLSL